MARSSLIRTNVALSQFQNSPETTSAAQDFWAPAGGMVTSLPPEQIPPTHCVLADNVVLRYGHYETKPSESVIGDVASGDLVGAGEFRSAEGIGYLVRWLTTKMQIFDGNVWGDVVGVTLTGTIADRITFASYGNLLIFSNGVVADGMWQVDIVLGTGSQIAGAPAARHITVFGKRVIASAPPGTPNRVQWSVKGDSTDWSSLSSGYEDLLGTPGGDVDEQFCVIPVTDTLAFVHRSDSTWTMSEESANFDTPFVFNRTWAGLGCKGRFAVAAIPGGSVFVGSDGIYTLTVEGGKVDIGIAVADQILGEITDTDSVYLVYLGPKHGGEIVIFPGNDGATPRLYRGQMMNKSWTSQTEACAIQSLATAKFASALSFDELPGTIESLAGNMNVLGTTVGQRGILLAQASPGRYVVGEDFEINTALDIDADGETVDFDIAITSGGLFGGSALNRVEILFAQLSYKVGSPTVATLDYSTDGGSLWQTYGVETLDPSTTPRLATWRNSIEAERLQIRVRIPGTYSPKVYGFWPHLVAGRNIGLP